MFELLTFVVGVVVGVYLPAHLQGWVKAKTTETYIRINEWLIQGK